MLRISSLLFALPGSALDLHPLDDNQAEEGFLAGASVLLTHPVIILHLLIGRILKLCPSSSEPGL